MRALADAGWRAPVGLLARPAPRAPPARSVAGGLTSLPWGGGPFGLGTVFAAGAGEAGSSLSEASASGIGLPARSGPRDSRGGPCGLRCDGRRGRRRRFHGLGRRIGRASVESPAPVTRFAPSRWGGRWQGARRGARSTAALLVRGLLRDWIQINAATVNAAIPATSTNRAMSGTRGAWCVSVSSSDDTRKEPGFVRPIRLRRRYSGIGAAAWGIDSACSRGASSRGRGDALCAGGAATGLGGALISESRPASVRRNPSGGCRGRTSWRASDRARSGRCVAGGASPVAWPTAVGRAYGADAAGGERLHWPARRSPGVVLCVAS